MMIDLERVKLWLAIIGLVVMAGGWAGARLELRRLELLSRTVATGWSSCMDELAPRVDGIQAELDTLRGRVLP